MVRAEPALVWVPESGLNVSDVVELAIEVQVAVSEDVDARAPAPGVVVDFTRAHDFLERWIASSSI